LPRVEFNEPLVEEVSDFVSSITEQRQPLADGASGLAVVKLLERLSESMNQGVMNGG
jgi:predicted dehydrogenase